MFAIPGFQAAIRLQAGVVDGGNDDRPELLLPGAGGATHELIAEGILKVVERVLEQQAENQQVAQQHQTETNGHAAHRGCAEFHGARIRALLHRGQKSGLVAR